MRRFLPVLPLIALVVGLPLLMAQVPNFPQTLPQNTVVGRIGAGTGPSQAIPFSTLWTQLAPFAPMGGTTPGAMPGTPNNLFVSPSGNDSNNCLSALSPCLTLEHAIDLSPLGAISNITLAHGTYTTSAGWNIFYYRTVNIVGDCGAPTTVVLHLAGNNLASITAQDHALVTINCVTFTTNGSNNTVLATRQLAISDLDNVTISTSGGTAWSGGTIMSATENSSANMGGTVTLGSGIGLATFSLTSTLAVNTLAATVVMSGSNSVTNFFVASGRGYIKAQTLVVSGTGFAGTQCAISGATLDFPTGGLSGTSNSCNAFNGGIVN